MGKEWKQWLTLFSWAPKSLWTGTAAMKLKDPCSCKKSYDKPRQHIIMQRHYFANKGPYSWSYKYVFFSTSHEWMRASLVAQKVKRLPVMRETRVQSLGREDPLEKEMATHSSTFAWRILWTDKHGGLQSTWGAKSRTRLSDFTHLTHMNGCESWTIKKVEHWIIDAFELWCWRRL